MDLSLREILYRPMSLRVFLRIQVLKDETIFVITKEIGVSTYVFVLFDKEYAFIFRMLRAQIVTIILYE